MIFMSGLKADMSGGLSVMRAEHAGQLQDYLDNEPLLFMEYRSTGWLNLMFIT